MKDINVENKDREFISIWYYIRIRNNFKIFLPHKNKEIKVSWLFNSLKKGEFLHYRRIIKMGIQLYYLSGCKTHLQDIERIEKLTLIVMIAFVWCSKAGIFIHENIKKIEIENHGRKAKSIFKCGLSYIANVLLNAKNQSNINIFSFLSCTDLSEN